VRFLIDANLSPDVARILTAGGHDAVAVRDLGLQDASDDEIVDVALDSARVIVSHDTDFGALLAARRLTGPSFVLIRSADPLTTDKIAALILDNLAVMIDDLERGAIVTFARGHLRSRPLPLRWLAFDSIRGVGDWTGTERECHDFALRRVAQLTPPLT
jgi:predicted nuclease of predicted toxin-antitoxin system